LGGAAIPDQSNNGLVVKRQAVFRRLNRLLADQNCNRQYTLATA
jgi:hypothetical protein